MALADYQTLVDSMVRDQSGTVTSDDRDRAIELARLRYSGDAERQLTQDVTWLYDGAVGPMPAGWTDGAYLLDWEWPIGTLQRSGLNLAVYVTPTGVQLMADIDLPVGTVVRVRFGVLHTLAAGGDTQDTIPTRHREAVASYAAHLLCRQLAAYFSGERESSIGADGSNTDSRARNYSARAKEYRAAYFGGLGIADPQASGASGASSFVGQPAASVTSWPGRSRYSLTRRGLQ
ncbi:hypothetical protein [Rhodoferax sp.]|uniref:hypothetical protein n=1 Tax=Rhodoferax sp. TaxID=50421 RepID=UPI00374CF324